MEVVAGRETSTWKLCSAGKEERHASHRMARKAAKVSISWKEWGEAGGKGSRAEDFTAKS